MANNDLLQLEFHRQYMVYEFMGCIMTNWHLTTANEIVQHNTPTRVLSRYKDVVLPVYEFPLQR